MSEVAPSQALSFAARTVVTTPSARTFVDGVACRQPDASAVETIAAGATDVVTVTEDEAAQAIRLLYRSTHHLAEPAGAIALAALWNDRASLIGKRVAFPLCGANMDTAMAAQILSGGTPQG